jgi:hypothetical protein
MEWLYQKGNSKSCPNCRAVFRNENYKHAVPNDPDLYSVIDVIDSEAMRASIRDSAHNIDHLTERLYHYDVAVEIAMVFGL